MYLKIVKTKFRRSQNLSSLSPSARYDRLSPTGS